MEKEIITFELSFYFFRWKEKQNQKDGLVIEKIKAKVDASNKQKYFLPEE